MAAEAPDGTVHEADPASPEVVYALRAGAPVVAVEHPGAAVTALAADAALLYVATGRAVTGYSRTTGKLVRSWPVSVDAAAALGGEGPPNLVLVAGLSRLWLLAAGSPDTVDEIDPASASPMIVVHDATGVGGIAVGPDGAYVVTGGGVTLVRITVAGSQTSAPTGIDVDPGVAGPTQSRRSLPGTGWCTWPRSSARASTRRS